MTDCSSETAKPTTSAVMSKGAASFAAMSSAWMADVEDGVGVHQRPLIAPDRGP